MVKSQIYNYVLNIDCFCDSIQNLATFCWNLDIYNV